MWIFKNRKILFNIIYLKYLYNILVLNLFIIFENFLYLVNMFLDYF